MSERTDDVLGRIKAFWDDVAEIPQYKRGMVWCKTCGKSQKVDAVQCLKTGWPECCGYTMSIDPPPLPSEERGMSERKKYPTDDDEDSYRHDDNPPPVQKMVKCTRCDGKGTIAVTCDDCGGEGEIPAVKRERNERAAKSKRNGPR
jgi:RecJ-like exonuclease